MKSWADDDDGICRDVRSSWEVSPDSDGGWSPSDVCHTLVSIVRRRRYIMRTNCSLYRNRRR